MHSRSLIDEFLRLNPETGNETPVGVGLVITERHPHRILTVVENGSAAACGTRLHICSCVCFGTICAGQKEVEGHGVWCVYSASCVMPVNYRGGLCALK